jgi:hypothetical protein
MNQELFRTLERESQEPIMAGLSEKESAQAEELFSSMLRSIMEIIYQTPVQQQDAIARRAGEALIRRMASVPSKDRVNHLIRERFDQEVHHLDIQTFTLARQVLISPNLRESLIPQARTALEKAGRLREEIIQVWHEQGNKYGRIFSEVILDCHYVLNPTTKTSLRLGKLMKVKKRL